MLGYYIMSEFKSQNSRSEQTRGTQGTLLLCTYRINSANRMEQTMSYWKVSWCGGLLQLLSSAIYSFTNAVK